MGLDDDIRVVKLRGLPWSATKKDIVEFFHDCKIYKNDAGVHIVMNSSGKASGEAFVEVPPDDDIDVFLRKHKKEMGPRYVEVFKATRSEMEWSMKRSQSYHSDDDSSSEHGKDDDGSGKEDDECQSFVRLRGLPFECTKEDIQKFLEGLEIASGGIHIMMDNLGRPSGEAYVEFTSKEQADKARGRDKECIGRRYIETFRVSPTELRNMRDNISRNSYGRGYDRHHPYERSSSSRYGDRGRYSGRSRYNRDDDWNYGGGYGRSSYGGSRSSRSSDSCGNSRHCLLMRGLPFRANEYDVRKFFDPLSPIAIDIIYDSSGRPSGTAKVQFASGDECTRAMGKHKDRMEHRYIELFLHSP